MIRCNNQSGQPLNSFEWWGENWGGEMIHELLDPVSFGPKMKSWPSCSCSSFYGGYILRLEITPPHSLAFWLYKSALWQIIYVSTRTRLYMFPLFFWQIFAYNWYSKLLRQAVVRKIYHPSLPVWSWLYCYHQFFLIAEIEILYCYHLFRYSYLMFLHLKFHWQSCLSYMLQQWILYSSNH